MAVKNSLFKNLDDKSEKICRAAVELFHRKRFEKTTVSEIAGQAGVGKGTFYLYFNSKEDLLKYLIDYGIEQMIQYVSDRISDSANPVERLEEAIDAQLEYFDKYQRYFSFFVREIWSYRDGLKEPINNLKENYINIFEEIINDGITDGSMQKVNAETIASGLFGFLSISAVRWVLFSDQFPAQEIDQDVKKILFDGVLV